MSQKTETSAVVGTTKGFDYWAARDGLSPTTKIGILEAAVVVAPKEGFRDHPGPIFPDGTIELFRFFKTHLPGGLKVAVAAEESTYREVALHYDVIRLATLVLEYVAAPTIVGLIVEYLKNRLQSRFSQAEVESCIVVDRIHGQDQQTLEITFRGPAKTFQDTIMGTLVQIAEDQKQSGQIESPEAPKVQENLK